MANSEVRVYGHFKPTIKGRGWVSILVVIFSLLLPPVLFNVLLREGQFYVFIHCHYECCPDPFKKGLGFLLFGPPSLYHHVVLTRLQGLLRIPSPSSEKYSDVD